jgi:hypothetical protein
MLQHHVPIVLLAKGQVRVLHHVPLVLVVIIPLVVQLAKNGNYANIC